MFNLGIGPWKLPSCKDERSGGPVSVGCHVATWWHSIMPWHDTITWHTWHDMAHYMAWCTTSCYDMTWQKWRDMWHDATTWHDIRDMTWHTWHDMTYVTWHGMTLCDMILYICGHRCLCLLYFSSEIFFVRIQVWTVRMKREKPTTVRSMFWADTMQ